jgi:hypothetical protein
MTNQAQVSEVTEKGIKDSTERFLVPTSAVLGIVAAAISLLDRLPLLAALGFGIAVAVVIACIFLLFINRNLRRLVLNSTGLPNGVIFYATKNELDKAGPLFLRANSRVVILAIDSGLFVQNYYAKIREMCLAGKVFQFLLMDEESILLTRVQTSWGFMGDAQKVLRSALGVLAQIRASLPDSHKANLQIKFYDLIPLHSITIIDPDGPDSVMQVTLHRYNSHDWSYLVVSKRTQPLLFDSYFQSFRFVERSITRDYAFPMPLAPTASKSSELPATPSPSLSIPGKEDGSLTNKPPGVPPS